MYVEKLQLERSQRLAVLQALYRPSTPSVPKTARPCSPSPPPVALDPSRTADGPPPRSSWPVCPPIAGCSPSRPCVCCAWQTTFPAVHWFALTLLGSSVIFGFLLAADQQTLLFLAPVQECCASAEH